MATIVVAHGAWSSAWAWQKMRPLLRESGHDLFTPSYTGLGERGHHASPNVELDTHIADILAVLKFEDLNDVVLIGHSYGGMVATGVADRAEGRVTNLIYLDAFAPRDGQSLFDLVGPETESAHARGRRENRRRMEGAANPMPPDTPPDYVAWATLAPAAAADQDFRAETAAFLAHIAAARLHLLPAATAQQDVFGQFASRAKAEGWLYAEMDASHNPHITTPLALHDVLQVMIGRN